MKRRKGQGEEILKEIMAENFLDSMKKYLWTQDSEPNLDTLSSTC